jgi:hypothetical protein
VPPLLLALMLAGPPVAAVDDGPLVLDADESAPQAASDGLWWRAALTGGAACCGTVLCGAVPVSAGAATTYYALRSTDAVLGYAMGFFCGLGLLPLPGVAGALWGGGAALLAEYFSGLEVDWGSLLWTSAVALGLGIGAGTLAFAITFPVGFAIVESGQRGLATAMFAVIPAVVITGSALVVGGATGGMYFFSRDQPDETVTQPAGLSPMPVGLRGQ